jgi:hypothetical protein
MSAIASSKAMSQDEERIRAAFGNVVNVKSIPSRGVTRIEIELPIESHVEATQLLFGRDVLIMMAKLPVGTPYGIHDSAARSAPSKPEMTEALPAKAHTGRPSNIANPASSTAAQATPLRSGGVNSMLGRRTAPSLDPARWLGIKCSERVFQDWLGVTSSDEAAEMTRGMCGVRSRSEIAASPEALGLFQSNIFQRFNEYMSQHGGKED